jgi:hypothetical protein
VSSGLPSTLARSQIQRWIELFEVALFEVRERVTIRERVDRSVEMRAYPLAEVLFGVAVELPGPAVLIVQGQRGSRRA